MDYYIYHHVDPKTNKVMYVGLGQYDRAWCTRKNQRSEKHYEWLVGLYEEGYTLSDTVFIVKNKLSKQEALQEERKQVEEHNPIFNKLLNKHHWQKGRKFDKEVCEFAKGLREHGYGLREIAFLLGSPNPLNNVMSVKRMISYVSN